MGMHVGMSYPEVADLIQRRHHSTALTAYGRFKNWPESRKADLIAMFEARTALKDSIHRSYEHLPDGVVDKARLKDAIDMALTVLGHTEQPEGAMKELSEATIQALQHCKMMLAKARGVKVEEAGDDW